MNKPLGHFNVKWSRMRFMHVSTEVELYMREIDLNHYRKPNDIHLKRVFTIVTMFSAWFFFLYLRKNQSMVESMLKIMCVRVGMNATFYFAYNFLLMLFLASFGDMQYWLAAICVMCNFRVPKCESTWLVNQSTTSHWNYSIFLVSISSL